MDTSEIRRAIAFACLAFAAAFMAPTIASETGSASAATMPNEDAALDTIVDAVVDRYHLPGIAVGVIEDGRVAYTATRGEIAAGSGDPIDTQNLFKIASNS
jgi:CubicO group peptidase (beta-lactamase class C family)